MHFKWRHKNRTIRLSGSRLLIALGCSLLIICADYLLSNLSFPLFDESESLSLFAYLDSKNIPDQSAEVFCVNTGLDNVLVPVTDEFGDTLGYTQITDRSALLRLLEIAGTSHPKYVFLDIRFEKGLDSETDSALFAKMRSMPGFVFAHHRTINGYELADSSLLDNAALADYRSNMFSGFSRYEFIQGDEESVALRIYRELDGGYLKKRGPLYLSDGGISYNMQFIPLPANPSSPYGPEGHIRYPYLTSQVFGEHSDDELRAMMHDKIIIIGDFDNDIHQSYVGDMPGPLIHYYAYRFLRDGRQRVNIFYIIILLVAYTIIAYALLGDDDPTERITNFLGIKSPAGIFLFSFLSWGTVLTALKIFLYLTYKISYIASIPTIVFSIIVMPGAYRKIRATKLEETGNRN